MPDLDLARLLAAIPEGGLRSYGYQRAINTEARTVEVVVSTNKRARDWAIIDQRGWLLENYDKNPVVLWVHNDREYPIAKTISSRLDPDEASADKLVQVHEFATHGMANDVFDMIVKGFINATSVRWWPYDAAFELMDGEEILVFKKQELLETSWVPVPADPHCLAVRADGSRFDIRSILAAPPAPAVPEATPGVLLEAAGLDPAEVARLAARVDGLADSVSSLTSVLAQLAPAFALAARTPQPQPPAPTAPVRTEALETQIAAIQASIERLSAVTPRGFNAEGATVRVLAKLTGKTEETIRAQLGARG